MEEKQYDFPDFTEWFSSQYPGREDDTALVNEKNAEYLAEKLAHEFLGRGPMVLGDDDSAAKAYEQRHAALNQLLNLAKAPHPITDFFAHSRGQDNANYGKEAQINQLLTLLGDQSTREGALRGVATGIEQAFNLPLALCYRAPKPVKYAVFKFLNENELQEIGKILAVKLICLQRKVEANQPGKEKGCPKLAAQIARYRSSLAFLKSCYLEKTRAEHAETLRDHILHWRYDEVEACVKRDPQVLTVVCEWKANRWIKENEVVDKNSWQLNALEYAWVTGDENFIRLFEFYCPREQKPLFYLKKEALQAEWVAYRDDLAKALIEYSNGGKWNNLRVLWENAPRWVYGLLDYLYGCDISSRLDALMVDIFSQDVREIMSRQYTCVSRDGRNEGPGIAIGGLSLRSLALLISQNHRHSSRASFSKPTEQPELSNNLNQAPKQ